MADEWKLVYYYTAMGRCPVHEFLDELYDTSAADLIAYRDHYRPLLREKGPSVGEPLWKWIGRHSLGEIRWKGRDGQYRIYCSVESARRIVMYHAVKKAWAKFWRHDEDTTLTRKADFLADEDGQEKRKYQYLNKLKNKHG